MRKISWYRRLVTCVLLGLASGALLHFAYEHLRVHESQLLRRLWARLETGDLRVQNAEKRRIGNRAELWSPERLQVVHRHDVQLRRSQSTDLIRRHRDDVRCCKSRDHLIGQGGNLARGQPRNNRNHDATNTLATFAFCKRTSPGSMDGTGRVRAPKPTLADPNEG